MEKIKEIAKEIEEKVKPKRGTTGATITQHGKNNVAVVGDNNVIQIEKLSNRELRILKGKLDKWVELEMETNNLNIREARKKVFGIFKRKFKLNSYRDLPASQITQALSFIEGQIRKLENKLLRMGIESTPKQRLILRIYRTRSFLEQLSEEDFVRLLHDRFGKVDFSQFTLKELQTLFNMLSRMR